MKTINVKVTENDFKVYNQNAITNFAVSPEEYDLGMPVGYGADLTKAIATFIESWYLKFNEEIKVKINSH